MNDDLIKRSDAIKALNREKSDWNCDYNVPIDNCIKRLKKVKSADRPKHYCAECKYEPIDKRCMPCGSCINNPKNRDAFVLCEMYKGRG